MNVVVFDEKTKGTTLRLRLIECTYGVRVVVVDNLGVLVNDGHMLEINENGIRRIIGFNPRIGLPVDAAERVVDIV